MADWLGYWDDAYGTEAVVEVVDNGNTTFGEIKRQVLINFNKPDGRTMLVVEQAINNALKTIARVKDFDELKVLDITNAFTALEVKSYHIVNDLNLTRPKDIYSIRLMDEGNSRKLNFVIPGKLDDVIPYPELTGFGKSNWYTRRGRYLELFRIPDAIYPLYIQYSQWPAIMVANEDEIPFVNIDDVIVELASDMALSKLEGGGMGDWAQRAQQLLGLAVQEETTRPDEVVIAAQFNSKQRQLGEYWADPFYKG
jgi:hypothetical protein